MVTSFRTILMHFCKTQKSAACWLTFGTLFWAFTVPLAPFFLGRIIDSVGNIAEESALSAYYPALGFAMGFICVQWLRNCNYMLLNRNYAKGLSGAQTGAIERLFGAVCKKPFSYSCYARNIAEG